MADAPDSEPPGKDAPLLGIDSEISAFVHSIDALRTSFPIMAAVSSGLVMACSKNFLEFLEQHGEWTGDGKERTLSKLDTAHSLEANRLIAQANKAQAGARILPESFLVAIVSQYDSFLGRLLRCLYRARPELLKDSSKQLTYSQLHKFGSLDSAKEYILEKEVEQVLRDSHPDQFSWMESKFGLPLRKNLPAWQVFVEITERRNLFVHCNGQVTEQYHLVCDQQDVKFGKRPALGERLNVTREYFESAHFCVFEIGTKLAHTLWRKLFPQDRERADKSLIMTIYDLLVIGKYDLAIALGEFAVSQKDHASNFNRLTMVINLAQAYKWKGDDPRVKEMLDGEDWSPCNNDFQLAVAVLRDDFALASAKMKEVGAGGGTKVNDYRDWPLFRKFRKSSEFLATFNQIFGQPFQPLKGTAIDGLFSTPFRFSDVQFVEAKTTTQKPAITPLQQNANPANE